MKAEQVLDVSGKYADALMAHYQAYEHVVTSKEKLETAEREARLAGEINGPNEVARKDQAARMFFDLRAGLRDAEAKERYTQMRLDITRVQWQEVRLLVQIQHSD